MAVTPGPIKLIVVILLPTVVPSSLIVTPIPDNVAIFAVVIISFQAVVPLPLVDL